MGLKKLYRNGEEGCVCEREREMGNWRENDGVRR